MTWILIDELEKDRQYQFWVTAVTSAGEGMRSDIVLETSSGRGTSIFRFFSHVRCNVFVSVTVPARVSDVGRVVYAPQNSRLELGCQVVGDPVPTKKWFLNGRDDAWLNRRTTEPNYGSLVIDDIKPETAGGNFTCYVENKLGSDSVNYNVRVQGKTSMFGRV